MNSSIIKNGLGMMGLALKKNAPTILQAVGVTSIIGGVILGCKQTLKVEPILDTHKESMEIIDDEEYAPDDEKKYKTAVFTKTVLSLGKTYVPVVLLEAFGIGCLLSSQHILKIRYTAAVGAYNALDASFQKYRKRVKEDFGEEMDRHFLYGTKTVKNADVFQEDENGELTEKTKKENVTTVDINDYSIYSRFFDQSSTEYDKDSPALNKSTVIGTQQFFNALLKARGYVFLNEVYEKLGFDPIPEGQLVGWLRNDDDYEGDGHIDFRIFDAYSEANRRFVNGYEPVILLDFNVDGIIYDKI